MEDDKGRQFVEKVGETDVYLDVRSGLFFAVIDGRESTSKNLKDLEIRIRKSAPLVEVLVIVPPLGFGRLGDSMPKKARVMKVRGVHGRTGHFIDEHGQQMQSGVVIEYDPNILDAFEKLQDEWDAVKKTFGDRYDKLCTTVLGTRPDNNYSLGPRYTKELSKERLKELQDAVRSSDDSTES